MSVCLCVCVSVCLCVCVSVVCLSACLVVFLSAFLFACTLAFTCACVVHVVCLTNELFLWMCVHAFVRALACITECVHIFVYVNVYVFYLTPQTNQITTISKIVLLVLFRI